jgi:hypothetical protein
VAIGGSPDKREAPSWQGRSRARSAPLINVGSGFWDAARWFSPRAEVSRRAPRRMVRLDEERVQRSPEPLGKHLSRGWRSLFAGSIRVHAPFVATIACITRLAGVSPRTRRLIARRPPIEFCRSNCEATGQGQDQRAVVFPPRRRTFPLSRDALPEVRCPADPAHRAFGSTWWIVVHAERRTTDHAAAEVSQAAVIAPDCEMGDWSTSRARCVRFAATEGALPWRPTLPWNLIDSVREFPYILLIIGPPIASGMPNPRTLRR